MKPSHHEDILKQLRFQDGAPLRALTIEENIQSIKQTMALAADEIERLRAEILTLRSVIRRGQHENQ
jgi:hypothetical protein